MGLVVGVHVEDRSWMERMRGGRSLSAKFQILRRSSAGKEVKRWKLEVSRRGCGEEHGGGCW